MERKRHFESKEGTGLGLLPWQNRIFLALLCLGAVIGMKYCINTPKDSLAYTNSFFGLALWAAGTFALSRLTGGRHWKEIAALLNKCFFPVFLFVGAMTAGVQLDNSGRVDFASPFPYLAAAVLAVCASPVLAFCIWKLENREYGKTENILSRTGSGNKGSRKYFFTVWLILALAYIPTLLASWPGFFTYDAEVETYMVFTDKYSAHHPVVHVVLLGWILRLVYRLLQSYNAGIAVYLILQILIVSGCFAYMMNFLWRIGVRRFLRNLGIVFLGLFPVVSMFLCCTTKDVYFCGGIVLFTTLLLEMAREGKTFWSSCSKKLLFVLASLMILFFRNNGLYAYIIFILIFSFVYKEHWKKWLPVLGMIALSYGIVTGSLNVLFKVKPGEMAEMLCVPMQQLARVHAEAEEVFSDEDKEVLYTLIPEVILEDYNPKLADNVKVNFLEDNFKASPGKYISLWAGTGLKRPDIYVNSFLANTYGYWYPDTVLDGYTGKWIVDRAYGDSSYFAFTTERPGIRNSLLPWLERFYEKISLEIYQQKIPVLSMLFSIGFWHWLYLFTAVYLLVWKYKKQAFALLFMGLVYLTVLLGPIALVRYVLYFFFCAPLLLALLFDTKVFVKKDLTNGK